MTRLPPSASVANPAGGAKLHAPAAARNAAPLCDLLLEHAPRRGAALELASGTGQHMVAFATALPQLSWQPSDVDADRCRSIDAHVAEAGLRNVAPARQIDVTAAGWSDTVPPQDLIVLINLLHLIPEDAARSALAEAARALTLGGRLIVYGPFKRAGRLTSEGDIRFDAELRGADPRIGYKDDRWMQETLAAAGLHVTLTAPMPANNLAFISELART